MKIESELMGDHERLAEMTNPMSENSLVTNCKFEIDREVIDDVARIAVSVIPPFPVTPPSNISSTEHKLKFVDYLVKGNNLIFSSTRRAVGNWIVAGVDVCNIIETLPGFRALPENTSMGVRHIGNLQGRWEVYKDPYKATLNYTIGHRGASFLDTGYNIAH